MKLVVVLCLIFLIEACSTSSMGRNQITLFSESELAKMGSSSFEQMKKQETINKDKATNDFVQCVVQAITKNVDKRVHKGEWEVVVFDSAQINAFALPSGKIGVYLGILNITENQDQLAAIIGHEVGHVIERHSNERLSSGKLAQAGLVVAGAAMTAKGVENKNLWMAGLGLGLQYGILMPYGRAHESEADIIGQNLMARSGFDPAASMRLWENMGKVSKKQPAEFLSTHPSHSTRIKQLSSNLSTAMTFYQTENPPHCPKPSVIPKPIPKIVKSVDKSVIPEK